MGNQPSTVRTYTLPEEAPIQSTSLPLPQLSSTNVDYGVPLVDPLDGIPLSSIPPNPQAGNSSMAFLDNYLPGGQLSQDVTNFGSGLWSGQQPQQTQQGTLNMLNSNWSDLGTMGKLGVGTSAVTGLFNMYNGFQQSRQMKDYMKNQMSLANKQYANNVKTYNTNMEDRQMRRVAANANAESVDSYMARNRVG